MESEQESKNRLRSLVRARLGCLPKCRERLDSGIVRHLESFLSSFPGYCLAAYAALSREPDLFPFLSQLLSLGRRLYLPRYCAGSGRYEMVEVSDLERDLRPGRYGILEPDASLPGISPPYVTSTPWVWFVPALGYDLAGHRLGHGGGYYDRLLGGGNGVKVGIAYECQLVDAVPFEAHDVCMDYVVTESRLHTCDVTGNKP